MLFFAKETFWCVRISFVFFRLLFRLFWEKFPKDWGEGTASGGAHDFIEVMDFFVESFHKNMVSWLAQEFSIKAGKGEVQEISLGSCLRVKIRGAQTNFG